MRWRFVCVVNLSRRGFVDGVDVRSLRGVSEVRMRGWHKASSIMHSFSWPHNRSREIFIVGLSRTRVDALTQNFIDPVIRDVTLRICVKAALDFRLRRDSTLPRLFPSKLICLLEDLSFCSRLMLTLRLISAKFQSFKTPNLIYIISWLPDEKQSLIFLYITNGLFGWTISGQPHAKDPILASNLHLHSMKQSFQELTFIFFVW